MAKGDDTDQAIAKVLRSLVQKYLDNIFTEGDD